MLISLFRHHLTTFTFIQLWNSKKLSYTGYGLYVKMTGQDRSPVIDQHKGLRYVDGESGRSNQDCLGATINTICIIVVTQDS